MIGNHVYPQGYRGFESLSLRPEKQPDRETGWRPKPSDEEPPFAPPFAPPLVEASVLRAAIDRITGALAMADDGAIVELVSERAALRAELRELEERDAGVTRLDVERERRGR